MYKWYAAGVSPLGEMLSAGKLPWLPQVRVLGGSIGVDYSRSYDNSWTSDIFRTNRQCVQPFT